MLNLYKWYSASSDWLCFIWRSCAHYQMCSRYHWNWKWLLSMYLWIDYWTWKFVWPRLALLKDLLYLLFNIENKSNCDKILQVFYVFELFWKVKIALRVFLQLLLTVGCTRSIFRLKFKIEFRIWIPNEHIFYKSYPQSWSFIQNTTNLTQKGHNLFIMS